MFGTTTFFPFSTSVSQPELLHEFTVFGHGTPKTFAVEPRAFVVPSLTLVSTTSTTTINFTIAASHAWNYSSSRLLKRTNGPVTTVEAPVGQAGTLGPAIARFDNVDLSNLGHEAGYELWGASVEVGDAVTGPLTVAILDEKGDEVDVAFF